MEIPLLHAIHFRRGIHTVGVYFRSLKANQQLAYIHRQFVVHFIDCNEFMSSQQQHLVFLFLIRAMFLFIFFCVLRATGETQKKVVRVKIDSTVWNWRCFVSTCAPRFHSCLITLHFYWNISLCCVFYHAQLRSEYIERLWPIKTVKILNQP